MPSAVHLPIRADIMIVAGVFIMMMGFVYLYVLYTNPEYTQVDIGIIIVGAFILLYSAAQAYRHRSLSAVIIPRPGDHIDELK